MIGSTRRDGEQEREELCTMLEKDMLLWKSFSSLENIFRVESEDREVRGHTGFVAQVCFTCKVLLTSKSLFGTLGLQTLGCGENRCSVSRHSDACHSPVDHNTWRGEHRLY